MKRWAIPLVAGILGLLGGAFIGFTVGYGWGYEGAAHLYQIDTYKECEAAGYPIQDKYPPACVTPDGRTYEHSAKLPETP